MKVKDPIVLAHYKQLKEWKELGHDFNLLTLKH